VQDQVAKLLQRLPQIITLIQDEFIPWLFSALGVELEEVDLDAMRSVIAENWQDVGGILGFIINKVSYSGQFLLSWFAYLMLVPVVFFYLLRDWDSLVGKIRALIPKRYEPNIVKLCRDCDLVLAEFLRGQLLVMSGLGIIYTVGLWIVGLEFALMIGMLAGLLSFIPYLGGIVGIGVASVAVFLQYHDFIHLIYVAIVFGHN